MERFFNTEGPNKPEMHYTIDPLQRWDLEEILALIRRNKYFVLHAPRQTGKTSAMLALVDLLNNSGQYQALYVNIETAQTAREDVGRGMKAILGSIAASLRYKLSNKLLWDEWNNILSAFGQEQALTQLLQFWAIHSNKPIVLMLDEVDALIGDTLISLLRQIRAGYTERPDNFPASIILCGVRDVRDYRIHSSKEKTVITGGSAFNIKAKSLRLGNFSQEDIRNLYLQHTAETGQIFEDDIWDLVYEYTHGQPWLVNALAYEVTYTMKENRDPSRPLTREIFEQAKENLILRRDTHLDQLVDKLQENRVRRVIEPLLISDNLTSTLKPDDVQYVRDLGLINVETNGAISIANGIYKEVIPRELSWTIQTGLGIQSAWYINEAGLIEIDKLLTDFQQFFREHSESWLKNMNYKEAAPELILQAFLQRVVNGGGRVDRQYALGRGRSDLLIQWRHPNGVQRIVIELKILRYSLEKTIKKGLEQTAEYMDKVGASSGHLILFDKRKKRKWEDRIFMKKRSFEGTEIKVWGC